MNKSKILKKVLSVATLLIFLIFALSSEKKKPSETLDGIWVENSRANNYPLFWDSVNALSITKLSENSYRVRYVIKNKDEFDEVFALSQNQLTGTVKRYFGLSSEQVQLIITDDNQIYYDNTYFSKWGHARK